MAILCWGVAILKSDISISLCQFSKKRPKKKINKEPDNIKLLGWKGLNKF